MLPLRLTRRFTDNVLSPMIHPQPLFCPPFKDCFCTGQSVHFLRHASSASSTRWKTRQSQDRFSKEAKVKGLKSRAAFKLLEMDEKYKLFKPANTVVDLGYAPGAWSQVAVSRSQPRGRVIGIDIIPAQPPTGVSTIQGNFLDPAVRDGVRAYVQDPERGRPRRPIVMASPDSNESDEDAVSVGDLESAEKSYIDLERQTNVDGDLDASSPPQALENEAAGRKMSVRERDKQAGRVVDVVLSDMSAPWDLTSGMWVKSVSDPYRRMMNTSGMPFRDHAGSMDLCLAALSFCFDALRTGGHFVCKFYQGAEEKSFEKKLKRMFEKVHREKPAASRDASKEAYFVALRRKPDPARDKVFDEN